MIEKKSRARRTRQGRKTVDDQPLTGRSAEIDTDAFRLRRFVDRLIALGEVELHSEPVALADIGAVLDGNAKAVLFRKAGPEGVELVGNVMGSRARLAAAFGVAPTELAQELGRRMAKPQRAVEISSREAPVHEVVLTGDDADFTRLPAHLQHALDGGPYISAGLDFAVDPETGWINVGSRRLMLMGRKEAGLNLHAPSDLRELYRKAVARGETLPVSFTVGAHPSDFMAAAMRVPVDEIALIGTLRGAPIATVKGVTNGVPVPADSEIVLEGYFDARGYVDPEGPYGETFGYYGVMKPNPVFHLTAITMRRDALFQTVTISGYKLSQTDTAQIAAARTESLVWTALRTAVREPVAVYCTASGAGVMNVRVSLRQRVPGEARNAIAAVHGSVANVKNIYIVDDDIDVLSDEQMDWAMATRFQPDRDLVVASGFRTLPHDPSLDGRRVGSKAGYDLTLPFGKRGAIELSVPVPPRFDAPAAKFTSVRDALAAGPKTFHELMATLGSRDGREIVLALDEIRKQGRLKRLERGEWALTDGASK
jgi:UbiD family decarboxylase